MRNFTNLKHLVLIDNPIVTNYKEDCFNVLKNKVSNQDLKLYIDQTNDDIKNLIDTELQLIQKKHACEITYI